MAASTQDMINQLLAQTTVAPQPSLFGLQAPPNPADLQALLGKLKQSQQQQDANAPTPGAYGYLHDAGKAAFNSVGSQLGTALGQGITQAGQQAASQQAPSADNPAPPLTNQQAVNAAIQKGKQVYQAQISAGTDPDVAKLNTLKVLTSLGVPGADAQLETAQADVLKNAQTRAETAKNNSQSKMDDSDITKNDIENKSKQFSDTYTDPEGYFKIQTNGNGESRRVELKPGKPPFVPPAGPDADNIAQKIANYDLQLSTVAGRGGPDARQYWLTKAIALNPDYDEKNFKQSQDALKAYGPSGTQGQMMLKTQNAMNHLDALKAYGAAVSSPNPDPQVVQRAQNALSEQLGGIPIASYNAVAPIVANEVSGALVKGGGGVGERQDRVKALGAQLTTPQRDAAIDGMRSLLGAQYQNNKNIYKQTTLRNDFEQRFPVAGGFPAPPGAAGSGVSGPPAATSGPSAGWGPVQVSK
jgi:hypothetical protein